LLRSCTSKEFVTAELVPHDTQIFATLVELARQHDPSAITQLYQRALPPLYRYVLARVRHKDLVDDVLAEIVLEMVEALPTLRANHEAGFFAWIFHIAHSKVMTALRQHVRYANRIAPLPDDDEAAEQLLLASNTDDPVIMQEWRESLTELGSALGELTEDQQFVIVGRFLAGHSIEELAQALNKRAGAIRALQFRALTMLAARMGERRGTGG
jgi:RNA polymerase sigma-70 factor (ECF subfamily)